MNLKGKYRKMRTKKNKKEKIFDRLLEMPEEISNKETKITILGFKKVLLENYITILEYQDFYIRIKISTGIININGFNMVLEEMNSDDILIIGTIDSIDFEKIEE